MKIIEKNISDRFLSHETVLQLGRLCGMPVDFCPLFYDIETTGLSKKTTQLYLIGVIFYQNSEWMLKQWFAENPLEESLILKEFISFSEPFSHTIQYNGTHFDAPYLRERCSVYGLTSPIDTLPALDLYQFLKPWKLFLQLNHMRQSDIEQFLELPERLYPDGKECIRHYKVYVKNMQEKDLVLCLGHNEEDLIGMGHVFRMLYYQGLFSDAWTYENASFETDQIIFQIRLDYPVPIPVSGGIPGIYLRAENDSLRILSHVTNGKLQQFYLNYKDYDFLIQENTAIPKTLGTYIDKSLKKNATLETCYTWFPYTDEFKTNPQKQLQYLKHLVPYLLKILCK